MTPDATKSADEATTRSSILHACIFTALRAWLFVFDMARRLDPANPNSAWRKVTHFDRQLTHEFESCDTLDKIWHRAVDLFKNKHCVGTRKVLNVEEEMQSDGRLFGKLKMGTYTWQTYQDVQNLTTEIGSALIRFDVKHGDKAVILSETRAEWMITALTCFRYQITAVTLYPTLSDEAIAHTLKEVETEVIFTSQDLAEKIIKIVAHFPLLRLLVYYPSRLPGAEALDAAKYKSVLPKSFRILSYNELVKFGSEKTVQPTFRPNPSDVAMIMYTSGTTGTPKGVVLTHENIVAGNAGQCNYVRNLGPPDIFVGYLPAAHVLELTAEFGCITHGVPVGYSSPLTLTDKSSKIQTGTLGDLSVLKPTLMAAVPTIMDRIYKTVMETVENSSPFKRALFRFCYERKRSMIERGYETPFIDLFIFRKVRAILGGKVRMMLSGGAPLNAETQRFMNICFCCPVGQGYGLTETSGAGTVCEVDDISTGRCGPPLACVDVKLRDWLEGGYRLSNRPWPQGEILFSGVNVASCYFNNPTLTSQDFIFIDGRRWLATGDIGEMHADGSLRVVDRKKDLIKMQHGEYISLAKVESALLTNPLVDNVCAYGNPLSTYMVALVVPNENNLRNLANKLHIISDNLDDLRNNKKVSDAVLTELQAHAKRNLLEKYERPEKIHLCKEIWTVDSGLLTDAMKLKRKPLEKFYKDILQQLYNGYAP